MRRARSMNEGFVSSAAEGVAERRTHTLHRRFADGAGVRSQRRLGDRVKSVAVDNGWPVEASLLDIELDLCGDVANRGGDLSDGHESARIDDLWPSQHENRPPLAADLGEPDLAAGRR